MVTLTRPPRLTLPMFGTADVRRLDVACECEDYERHTQLQTEVTAETVATRLRTAEKVTVRGMGQRLRHASEFTTITQDGKRTRTHVVMVADAGRGSPLWVCKHALCVVQWGLLQRRFTDAEGECYRHTDVACTTSLEEAHAILAPLGDEPVHIRVVNGVVFVLAWGRVPTETSEAV